MNEKWEEKEQQAKHSDYKFISKYYKFNPDNSNNNYCLTKDGFQKDGVELPFTISEEGLIHILSWNQDIYYI